MIICVRNAGRYDCSALGYSLSYGHEVSERRASKKTTKKEAKEDRGIRVDRHLRTYAKISILSRYVKSVVDYY